MSEQFLYFLQQMFNGVTLGSTYALIAIGYTMVYGIIGMINFAHGEVYMIGSYVSFMIIAALMMMGIDSSWLLVAAGFVGAIVIASAYGWSIERVAYRPVRSSKRLIALISAIGMSIFLQNYVSLTEGSRDGAAKPVQRSVGGRCQRELLCLYHHHAAGDLGGDLRCNARPDGLYPLLAYGTRLPCLRRRSEDGEPAWHQHRPRYRPDLCDWGSDGGGRGCPAGAVLRRYQPVHWLYGRDEGFHRGGPGGIGSIPGAMIGGLILGVAEALSSAYLSTEYKDVVSFALLILVLLVMPTGILGRPEVEKV